MYKYTTQGDYQVKKPIVEKFRPECASNRDCKDGLVCNKLIKMCEPSDRFSNTNTIEGFGTGAQGSACTKTSDCRMGLMCEKGKCVM